MIIRFLAVIVTAMVTSAVLLGIVTLSAGTAITAIVGGLAVFGVAVAIVRLVIVGAPLGIAGGTAALAGMVMLFSGTLAVGVWNRDENETRFLEAHRHARMPSVFDNSGRWIGAYPAGAFADYEKDPSLPGRMSVASRQAPPPYFVKCTLFLEDRSFKNWLFAGLGVDFIGVLRAFATGHGGASNLIQMVSRAMRGLTPGRNEPFVDRWRRKLLEWSDSPALAAVIMAPDVDPIDFVASNLKFVIGYKPAHVGDLPAGLEYGSRTIFGVPPEALPPEAQLVFSASLWQPMVIAPDNDPAGLAAVDGRWAKLLNRARRCAPLVAQQDGVSVEQVIAKINALRAPRVRVAEVAFKQDVDANQRFRVAAHPARRLIHIAGAAGLQAINRELSNDVGTEWRGKVNAVELGIDADRQFALTTAVEQAVAGVEARFRGRLQLRLTGPNDAADRAQVLAVVTDLDGVIRGFFESGPTGALDQKRQGGSVDKIIGAAILGHYDRPGTAYCNKEIPGLHNAGGHAGAANCSVAGAYIAARDVFARSVTLALVNRLSKLPPAEIEKAITTLGLDVPAGTPPATAVAAGYVEGTPRSFLRLMSAIGRVIAGREGNAALPHVIKRLELASAESPEAHSQNAGALAWADTKPLLLPSKAFMLDVLGAPLLRGTLASMSGLHQSRNPKIRWHIAKTGTSTVRGGQTRDAMIMGAFENSDGRAYAYFVLAGAPEPRRPLGYLNGAQLAPIATAVVSNFLIGRSQNGNE